MLQKMSTNGIFVRTGNNSEIFTHELIIFTKFHKDGEKIVDFLQGAKKGTAEIIRGTGFSNYLFFERESEKFLALYFSYLLSYLNIGI